MRKKLFLILIFLVFIVPQSNSNAQTDGLYYSSKMVENATFVWNVTISQEYYEDIPEGVNFTVTLKDDLYPGPLSEEDLGHVYASVKVDGNKYTGEGFPIFWHLYEIEGVVNTTIREVFEAETTLFNVTDGPLGRFYVNFTITDNIYTLFVELEIDPLDGLTKRYYEHFYDNDLTDSMIELNFIDYYIEIPLTTPTPTTTPTTDSSTKTLNSINFLFISLALGTIVVLSRRLRKK